MKIVAQERCTKQKNAGTIACQHQNRQYVREKYEYKAFPGMEDRINQGACRKQEKCQITSII